MTRSQHVDITIQQNRHRILCGLLTGIDEGRALIDRARNLGFPVDWQDMRAAPNRAAYSDFGAIFLLAKDVVRAEETRKMQASGERPDYIALDANSSRSAQKEAATIFNQLHKKGIELSGYADGQFFTTKQPMPWNKAKPQPSAQAGSLRRSKLH